jgi:hypothetical protein
MDKASETNNLQALARKMIGKELITNDEFQAGLTDIVNVFAQYRSATKEINEDTKKSLNLILKTAEDLYEKAVEEKSSDSKERKELLAQMKEIIAEGKAIAFTPGKKGDKGEPGKQGDPGDKGEPGKDGSPDTAEQVRDKLETLKEEDRLDVSAIKGLEEFVKRFKTKAKEVTHAVMSLSGLFDVSVSGQTNGQALVWDSTLQRWKNGTVSGGSGISRSINVISTATNAAADALTDYIYLVSGTTTVTLPTAVGNTNLYTVKNAGSAVVTVDTTGGQTIDGGATYTINVPYAVDFISNNSNWFII